MGKRASSKGGTNEERGKGDQMGRQQRDERVKKKIGIDIYTLLYIK